MCGLILFPFTFKRLESTALLVMSSPSGKPSLWSLHDNSLSKNRYVYTVITPFEHVQDETKELLLSVCQPVSQ